MSTTTQALGTFGVYGQPGDAELSVLAAADEYRERLVQLEWDRFREFVDLRNERHPLLYAALVEHEAAKARIGEIEREIKQLHSDERNRNALTVVLEGKLKEARKRRDVASKAVTRHRKEWFAEERTFKEVYQGVADWKNVKSLDKRREMYAAIDWPDEARPYAELWLKHDLLRRDLGKQYLHVHPTIRAEIVAATREKRGRTSPGMRYWYHRPPDEQPWRNLTVQIPGGLLVKDAIAGNSRAVSLTPLFANHKSSRTETVYECRQQIGTAASPAEVTYNVKFHRPLPLNAIIQRWTLQVNEDGRRRCIPLLKEHGLSKPIGKGLLTYDLTWRRVKGGIQVCHFLGDHVNERLVLPDWLISNRLTLHEEQQLSDQRANSLLAARGAATQPGKRQGVAALQSYCAAHPEDLTALGQLQRLESAVHAATRLTQRAIRCIETVYDTVVYRVCSRHNELAEDPIDLAKLKRYNTRDLLKVDVIPRKSRSYLQAVAPGKLQARLKRYGLASGEVPETFQGATRETDLFTSYVDSLSRKTGPKPQAQRRCSRYNVGLTVAAQGHIDCD